MNRPKNMKLKLLKETIRSLNHRDLERIRGGLSERCESAIPSDCTGTGETHDTCLHLIDPVVEE